MHGDLTNWWLDLIVPQLLNDRLKAGAFKQIKKNQATMAAQAQEPHGLNAAADPVNGLDEPMHTQIDPAQLMP